MFEEEDFYKHYLMLPLSGISEISLRQTPMDKYE